MIVEMRTYQTKPGKRAQFLDRFRELTMPEHARLGMAIAGPYPAIDAPDTFFFMRGFPDLESREELKARFYDGPLWKEQLEGELMPLLETYQVVLVEVPEGVVSWNIRQVRTDA